MRNGHVFYCWGFFEAHVNGSMLILHCCFPITLNAAGSRRPLFCNITAFSAGLGTEEPVCAFSVVTKTESNCLYP